MSDAEEVMGLIVEFKLAVWWSTLAEQWVVEDKRIQDPGSRLEFGASPGEAVRAIVARVVV